MNKHRSHQTGRTLPKRVRAIGIAVLAGLFLTCCMASCTPSVSSKDKTSPAGVGAAPTQAASALPLPARTDTSTAKATASAPAKAAATHTPAPTATVAPTDTPAPTTAPASTATQAPASLHACLPAQAQVETAQVVKVVDGDTIEVRLNGSPFTVRYIGVDTPETKDPNTPVQFYGPEAAQRNTELVANQTVSLVKDQSDTDQYGRLLRYVFVDGRFVNETLVKEGYAQAKAYPPDTACQAVFTQAETAAKGQALGLWSAPTTQAETVPTLTPTLPAAASSDGCPQGCLEQKPGCDIKGNINSKGEKIYHVPGGRDYNKTQIDPSNGERWFCTGSEAVANGWRAAMR